MPLPPVFRYQAFLSYAAEDNRAPGRPWADWLEETLSSYAVPRKIAGRPTPFGPVPPRIVPYKGRRDERDTLLPEARQALEQSATLIVICSPAAAQSAVVDEEVRHFKKLGRQRVIAFIVAGEPDADDPAEECFPEALRYEVKPDGSLDREWRIHPVVADARGGRGASAAERAAEARRLIIGAVLGVPPDFVGEVDARRGGEPAGVRGAGGPSGARTGGGAGWLALLLLLIAGGLGWYAYEAHQQKLAAEAARRRADDLIIFLQTSLREKLAAVGQLGVLAEINERVMEHLATVAREHKDPSALSALADAFGDSADVLIVRGNHAGALEPAIQAVQIRQRLTEASDAPPDAVLKLIGDQRRVAGIYLRTSQHTEALAVIEQCRTMAVALTQRRLGDTDVQRELARAHLTAGDIFAEMARTEEAEAAYTAGRDLTRELATRLPEHPGLQLDLARANERLGSMKEKQGDATGAMADLREWQRLAEAAAEAAPQDLSAQATVASGGLRIGHLLVAERRYAEAAAEFRKAAAASERVAKQAPTDRDAQLQFVTACRLLGAALAEGEAANRTEALAWFQRGLDHLDRHFPGDSEIRAVTMRMELQRVKEAVLKAP